MQPGRSAGTARVSTGLPPQRDTSPAPLVSEGYLGTLATPIEALVAGSDERWTAGLPRIQPDEQEGRWIDRAVALARRGVPHTSPNPAVGAVLVRNGVVVGEGYHRRAGGPHAEVVALQAAQGRALGSTLYVTLEPCSHWGRTPPCADALIAAGVRRVVACAVDPNPKVLGQGFARLAAAGVEVALAPESVERRVRRLNAPYEKFIAEHLPFVTLKAAMSLDGRIATATGESRWITSPRARRVAHRLRARHDAIVAGIGTVLADDPLLTVRTPGGRPARRQPLRVVLDSRARLAGVRSRLVESASPGSPVLVATTPRAGASSVESLRRAGVEVAVLPAAPGERVDLAALMALLAEHELTSVLVEGGPTVHASFLEAGLVDALALFVAPRVLGGASAPGAVGGAGAPSLSQAWDIAEWRVRHIPSPAGPPELLVEALMPGAVRRLERPCSRA